MSRRAATTTTSTWGVRSLLGRHATDDLMLQHCLVERHRHLLLRLEANRRLHLLRVLDRRQAQGTDDDALVADAEPDPLGELVLGEQRLQRFGEAVGIATSPSRKAPGGSGCDRRRRHLGRSVTHLGRGDAAGLDVQADHPSGLLLSPQLQHALPQSTERRQNFRPASTHLWENLDGSTARTCPDTSRRARRRPAGRPRRRARGRARRGSPACAPPRRGAPSSPARRRSRPEGRQESPGRRCGRGRAPSPRRA